MKQTFLLWAVLCLLAPLKNFSQTTGIIVRPIGSNGPAILDPNADGYTSKNTTGFGSDDIANSEIAYKVVPALKIEPTGDLLRGPSDRYSDIVKTVDGSGFYLYNDGTNLLCRIRMGGIVSGSKGYSVLLDTDGKFGTSGPYADPNYQPATTGINGNPGFELEIVFETNFRVAAYNVDGTSNPVLITSFPLSTHSQVSLAATTTSGDEDFFYDFYVPFSALGINASTPLRGIATTVMSPMAAIGGPKSDIYGLSGDNYMEDWIAGILGQPSFTLDDLKTSGSGIAPTCTQAPFLNGPILPTATTVTGTWTKDTNSSVTSAIIKLYKGIVLIDSTTVTSGNTWSINVSGLANNDVITAKAQGVGESMCLTSNSETVKACNSSNSPATPILACYSGSKGFSGTNLSTGWTVHVDNITRNTLDNSVTNSNALFGATSGSSPNITWPYSGGCSSGAPLTSGSYKVYYTDNITGCNSQPVYFCAAGNGGNALAGSLAVTITTPSNGVYTPATTSIAGTTTTGAAMSLYVNGQVVATTTAAAGTFSFSNVVLQAGQQVYVTGELNTGVVATSYCAGQSTAATVTCFTTPPVITVGNSNKLIAGSPITGTSSEATGTVVRVYTSLNALVATTTVQANGTWSTGNVGTTPATYNAVSATSYYANAQGSGCGVSGNSSIYLTAGVTSAARCGTLPGSVSETATTISGTLSGTALTGTVVTLYVDDISVGTDTTDTNAWGPIDVNTTANNTIYSGAVLKIGITEPSKVEVICATSVTVSCNAPTAPSIDPIDSTIVVGSTITYKISSPQSGVLYSIRDSATNENFGEAKFGSGGFINLVSNTFNSVGFRKLYIKATSYTGGNCQEVTAARVSVAALLPVSLIEFEGAYDRAIARLHWITSSEQNVVAFELQRSYTGNDFKKIATINAAGNSQTNINYTFNDSSASAGVVYYRLLIVDKNNQTTKYSKVIKLHIAKGIVVNSISPNPFSNKINIKVDVDKDVKMAITLIDMAGRKIKQISYPAKAGLNNILLSELNAIVKGTYLVELSASGKNICRQIIIKQ